MKSTTVTIYIGILICLLLTGGYSVILYRDTQKQLLAWNESAQKAFADALRIEVKKRGNTLVNVITTNPAEVHTLEEPVPDSVILTSKYGKKTYKIPPDKFEHSFVKERKKRMLLSILLEENPISVDILNRNWDSLLLAKKIIANTYIRYSITDLSEHTTPTYSNKYKQNLQADSLASCYMGCRCEMEATGFVFYQWWKMLDWWQWTLFCLPSGCLCTFILLYKRLMSFFRRKFREKEFVIKEKEVIVEKEIHIIDVETEKVEVYKLEDGTSFDSIERILRNGNKQKNVPPQIANLLELFFKADHLRLTEEEICQKMWGCSYNSDRLSTLILRLRQILKGISIIIVFYDNQRSYQLKMPHSIEENTD